MKEIDIKLQVINKLKEERKLKCPFCKHDRFRRVETCFCDMWDRGEDGICDEEISHEDYQFYCAKCGKEVTDEELL